MKAPKDRTSANSPSSFTIQNPPFKIALTAVKWLITFHLVTVLWLTFLMPDLRSIGAFSQGVFSGRTSFVGPPIFSLFFYGGAVVVYHAWGWIKEHRQSLAARLASPVPEGIVQGVMLFLIVTNPGAPRGFIYFQF